VPGEVIKETAIDTGSDATAGGPEPDVIKESAIDTGSDATTGGPDPAVNTESAIETISLGFDFEGGVIIDIAKSIISAEGPMYIIYTYVFQTIIYYFVYSMKYVYYKYVIVQP
jgi:hypothetical protein